MLAPLLNLGWFAIGGLLLYFGGGWLVDGAVTIGRRSGLSPLIIGLTIVAFGTSAPELAFNVTAALNGHGEMSFGNVVGSNIANIALVLGLAAVLTPAVVVSSRVVKKELPLLVAGTLLLMLLAWWPPGAEVHAFTWRDGCVLLVGMVGMTYLWYRMGRHDRSDPLASEARDEAREHTSSWRAAIFRVVLGLIFLGLGGKVAEVGAVGIAQWLGLSEALIGLTIVAIATSLPEVFTTLAACRKGHSDLAVGNVVGSNMFNVLLVLGLTSVLAPVPVPDRGWYDMLALLVLTLILLPIARTNQRRIHRGKGVFLLVCYVVYLTYSVIAELGAP